MEQNTEELEDLWRQVLERWDERSAHDAFLHRCHELQQLGLAASRYRSVIDADDETRKPAAQKRLGAVALLATQQLEAERTEPRRATPRWISIAAASITASAVGWLIYALTR